MRKLSFARLMLLILRKSRKSIQSRLNEFFDELEDFTISTSAFTQARAKLLHTAFVELNEKYFVKPYYEPGTYKMFKGHRVLAIDGTTVRLPESEDIRAEFGTLPFNRTSEKRYEIAATRSSLCYDVMNEVVLHADIGTARSAEREQAVEHLKHCRAGDIIVMDRGYIGYEMFASVLAANCEFLVRCPLKNSFRQIRKLLESPKQETIATLRSTKRSDAKIIELGIPKTLKCRLVKLTLPNGETEVLATSLLDSKRYPKETIADLYRLRWRVETYFNCLKNRLDVEAFTGKTAESVKQDFYASICLSNLETLWIEDLQEELNKNSLERKYIYRINKVVSFNAIKNALVEIAVRGRWDTTGGFRRVDRMLQQALVPVRTDRDPPRGNHSSNKRLLFHRTKRKIVF